MSFEERWLIRGELTTISNLHLGDGDVNVHEDLNAPSKEDPAKSEPIEISSVAVDQSGKPYLPGSSLKGSLRSWLARPQGDAALREELLGSETVTKENAVGSRTEFFDAPLVDTSLIKEKPPYWKEGRAVGIDASVTIDRKTRTAAPEKLFYREFVPAGATFQVTVACRGRFPEGLDEILFALAGFGFHRAPVTLGASTGDGWGRFEWNLQEIRKLEREGAKRWLEERGGRVGWDALEPLDKEEKNRRQQTAQKRVQALDATDVASLQVGLKLTSQFLVNDPNRAKKGADEPNQAPLLDADGHAFLPASSLRGALRSQAERILRTMGGDVCACPGDGSRGACPPLQDVGAVSRLCLACQLFGAPGWRAPLHFSDFCLRDKKASKVIFKQEFVAIDRFTGGGADKRKFRAHSVYKPYFTGRISLDLEAFRAVQPAGWAVALLCLLLRDLREGDVTLGYGASKGYGQTTSDWLTIDLPPWEALPKGLQPALDQGEYEDFRASFPETTPRPEKSLSRTFGQLQAATRERQSMSSQKGSHP